MLRQITNAMQIQVLLCTGSNSTGTCKYGVYALEKCHQLDKPFYKNTKTFAVDGEDFACHPRLTDCNIPCNSPTGCTFGAVDFSYKNKFNLAAIQWNNRIASFECFKKIVGRDHDAKNTTPKKDEGKPYMYPHGKKPTVTATPADSWQKSKIAVSK